MAGIASIAGLHELVWALAKSQKRILKVYAFVLTAGAYTPQQHAWRRKAQRSQGGNAVPPLLSSAPPRLSASAHPGGVLQDDKARKLDKPIPRTIREKALFVLSEDGAWEFLRAIGSNWDRDKLEYRGAPGEPVAA